LINTINLGITVEITGIPKTTKYENCILIVEEIGKKKKYRAEGT